jgi:hypothetical protein
VKSQETSPIVDHLSAVRVKLTMYWRSQTGCVIPTICQYRQGSSWQSETQHYPTRKNIVCTLGDMQEDYDGSLVPVNEDSVLLRP